MGESTKQLVSDLATTSFTGMPSHIPGRRRFVLVDDDPQGRLTFDAAKRDVTHEEGTDSPSR